MREVADGGTGSDAAHRRLLFIQSLQASAVRATSRMAPASNVGKEAQAAYFDGLREEAEADGAAEAELEDEEEGEAAAMETE